MTLRDLTDESPGASAPGGSAVPERQGGSAVPKRQGGIAVPERQRGFAVPEPRVKRSTIGPARATSSGGAPVISDAADDLNVAGLEPFSSCDWPGHLVATVFLQGCPWDCGYCHNASIIDPRAQGESSWAEVRRVLKRRKGLLDGVVFSGGEPTRQVGLANAMREVREQGFKVALHTGGAYPRRVQSLVDAGLVNWVGLDIKATPDRFDAVTRVPGGARPAYETLRILQEARVPMQVRTTVDPTVLTPDDVARLSAHLADLGVGDHVIQEVRTEGSREEFVERMTDYRRANATG